MHENHKSQIDDSANVESVYQQLYKVVGQENNKSKYKNPQLFLSIEVEGRVINKTIQTIFFYIHQQAAEF